MGSFSWNKADTLTQIENVAAGKPFKFLIPKEFGGGFIKDNYPGKEKETFEKLSKTQPIGRMGKPEEIAYLALYLCSEEASFITGTDFPIDGGFIKLNG